MTDLRRKMTCTTCGREWRPEGPRRTRCDNCLSARVNLTRPTPTQWRQLATDREVTAGHRAYRRGMRNPFTAAMTAEHGERGL